MIYLAGPGTTAAQLAEIVAEQDAPEAAHLSRRGFDLGWIGEDTRPAMPDEAAVRHAWHHDKAVMLPGILLSEIAHHDKDIEQSHRLMEATLNGAEIAPLLDAEPYASQLQAHFALVATSFEEHDPQGIEKLFFDAHDDGETIAGELWCKASWLSFHDEDASLRFRFSFGMEGYENVAADPERQAWAGKLTDAIFPESAAVTQHAALLSLLANMLDVKRVAFCERIIYFNAPNGGAQMHHDVERGHDGVVYAQMSGRTAWLALGKPVLIDEIRAFLARLDSEATLELVLPRAKDRHALRHLAADRAALAGYMESFDHELVEALIDRSPAFIQHLVEQGYAHVLHAGDVLLMPQRDVDTCVWHTVFCLDDEPGEGLSFAIRGDD